MGNAPNGKYTPEFIHEHNSKMLKLYEYGRMNQKLPMEKRPFKTVEGLQDAMIEYLTLMEELEIFPTEAGFIIYLGISPSAYYGIMFTESDPRAGVLEFFRCCVSEHINQAGLSNASNTLFTIYYLKSKMGQSDQGENGGMNVNINIRQPSIEFRGDLNEYREMIESTPKAQYLPPQKESQIILENKDLSSRAIIKSVQERNEKARVYQDLEYQEVEGDDS